MSNERLCERRFNNGGYAGPLRLWSMKGGDESEMHM